MNPASRATTTRLAHPEHALATEAPHLATLLPAWARPTPGEARWPVVTAVLAAIALQMLLPPRLAFPPHWLLPATQFVLLAGITAVNPGRISHSRPLRTTSLGLIATLTLANAWSAGLLIVTLVRGGSGTDAGPLLADGAAIWTTNVVVFALWYWELDGGGPAYRAAAHRSHPDFLFTQIQASTVTSPDWEPLCRAKNSSLGP